jgi:hypothetical protein
LKAVTKGLESNLWAEEEIVCSSLVSCYSICKWILNHCARHVHATIDHQAALSGLAVPRLRFCSGGPIKTRHHQNCYVMPSITGTVMRGRYQPPHPFILRMHLSLLLSPDNYINFGTVLSSSIQIHVAWWI